MPLNESCLQKHADKCGIADFELKAITEQRTLLWGTATKTGQASALVVEGEAVGCTIPDKAKQRCLFAQPSPVWKERFFVWARAKGRQWEVLVTDCQTCESFLVPQNFGCLDSLALNPEEGLVAILDAAHPDPDFPTISIYDLENREVLEPKCEELIGGRIEAIRWQGPSAFLCHNSLNDCQVLIPWDKAANALGWEPREKILNPEDLARELDKYAEWAKLDELIALIDRYPDVLDQALLLKVACTNLLQQKPDVRIIQELLARGLALSHRLMRCAAISRNLDILKCCVEAGGNIHAVDESGGNLLLETGYSTENTRYLLNHGLSVDTRDEEGGTPLHQFLLEYEVAVLLIEAGADLDAQDNRGRTPMLAQRSGDIFNLLLEKGANPHIADERGITPLFFGGEEHVQRLLDLGADPAVVDNEGNTPIHGSQSLEKIRLLVEAGCDPTHANKKGMTPLLQLAQMVRDRKVFPPYENVMEIMTFLVAQGANTLQPNKRGKSAIDLVSKKSPSYLKDFKDHLEALAGLSS